MENGIYVQAEREDRGQKELQDRLTGALIGLARATDGNEYRVSPSTHQAVLEGLSATAPNADLEPDALEALIRRVELEKARLSPECLACAAPCGRKDNYDMGQLWRAEEDIRGLKSRILIGIRGLAARGCQEEELYQFLYKALFAIGEDWGREELLPIVREADERNLVAPAPLDREMARPEK